jgi:hypothetical protein
MASRLLARSTILLSTLCAVAGFAAVTPYPPYPGAKPSPAFQVTVDGQPVFVHRFLTYDQFQFMDYASFSMTGKVHVTVTNLVGEMDVLSCDIRPMAYAIKPQMAGNTCSFDLDRPRYVLVFPNESASFGAAGLMLFAEPPEKNPPKLGDPNVVNILDYKLDNTGKTVETATINRAIGDVAARPGGGVLYFPAGVYMTGTLLMKSNVKLYVDAGALIKGTGKMVDYTAAPAPPGQTPSPRPTRAQVIFDHVENAGLMGRGAIDMEGYPKLWYDFAPDTADGRARNEDGIVKDPHGAGARGYLIDHCRNITFEDLLLLRSAEWTVHVIDTEHFTTRNIKIVNRKRQHHDDLYDLTGLTKHVLIEEGFAMGMDDTFALYGSRGGANWGLEDIVVKGFVNYTYDSGVTTGYGNPASVRRLRFEDVHFVSDTVDYAVWFSHTPRFWTGRGYPEGRGLAKPAPTDDVRFVNCTFETDGGHIYIDAGDSPFTNLVFENCTFYKPTHPSHIAGKNVGPVLFKNVKIEGVAIRNIDQLKRAGFDLSVPVKFE